MNVRRLSAVVATLAFGLAACGGDPDPAGFTRVGPQAFRAAVTAGDAVLIDLRNHLDPQKVKAAGLVLHQLGKSPPRG